MSRLTIISPRIMIRILESLAFKETRQKGSHKIFKHKDDRSTVIPTHSGEDLSRGLIRKILRDIEISTSKYEEIRKKIRM